MWETTLSQADQIKVKSKESQKRTYDFYGDMGGAQNVIFIYRQKQKNEQSWIYPTDLQSIACAAENIMLSAVNKGLGTCWVGSFNDPTAEKKLGRILGIKKNEELLASIVIGYPAKDFTPAKIKKKKLSELTNYV